MRAIHFGASSRKPGPHAFIWVKMVVTPLSLATRSTSSIASASVGGLRPLFSLGAHHMGAMPWLRKCGMKMPLDSAATRPSAICSSVEE